MHVLVHVDIYYFLCSVSYNYITIILIITALYYFCSITQKHIRVLSRKIILGGKLVLRAVLVAPGGGCRRGVCPLPHEARKLSPF